MSTPSTEELNISTTADETHSLGSHEAEDVGNVAASSSAPITSEEVAWQNKAVDEPLAKQLEKPCDPTEHIKT